MRRENQLLREQFDEFARQTARREQEMQAEIDSLRQALFHPRAQLRDSTDDDETRCAPGDLKAPPAPPSPSARASPPFPPAPRVPSPLPHVEPSDNVLKEFSSEKHVQNTEVADGEAGSEVEEQSMELATPLHPTILSLADDDLLIPPPIPPSPASSTSTRANVEPSDIPLPVSPNDDWDSAPPLQFSPFLASSPPHRQSSASALSRSAHSSPPLLMQSPWISPDLLARVESATQARVDEIEREVVDMERHLDAKTRELEDRDVALAQLRLTTSRLRGEIAGGDAGNSGGVHANSDPENTLHEARGLVMEEEEGLGAARGDVGGGAAAARGHSGLR